MLLAQHLTWTHICKDARAAKLRSRTLAVTSYIKWVVKRMACTIARLKRGTGVPTNPRTSSAITSEKKLKHLCGRH